LLLELARFGIPYRVGGSVGSSAYGASGCTIDADVVADLRPPDARALVDALRDSYYIDEGNVLDAIARKSSFNVVHLALMLKVDVFVLKTGAYDQQAFVRVRRDTLEEGAGPEFNLVTPEDLILNKLDWYRQGGGISERQWRDVIGVLKVQAGALDMEYLQHWAAEHGLVELLEQVLSESGGG
jgi:hypothetical protein